MNYKEMFLGLVENIVHREIKKKTPTFTTGVITGVVNDKTAQVVVNGVASAAPFMASRGLTTEDINSTALVLVQPDGKKYIIGCNK